MEFITNEELAKLSNNIFIIEQEWAGLVMNNSQSFQTIFL